MQENKKNMEKVIIVITTYNLEKFIPEALDSVLKQKTDFKFKILIGDDASTDKTTNILKSYKDKYPDIIELRLSEKNGGSLKNSNSLFDGLQCEYFSFLDGDDVWEDENRLQKQVDFLDSHEEYSMCAGNTQYIRDGRKAELLLQTNELEKSYTFEDFINHKMPFFHVSSILLRNTIYINGLPECYKSAENSFENCALRGEDFRRISHLEKGPLYAMPDLFSYYRIHDGGIWQGTSEEKRRIEGAIEYNFLRKYYLNTPYFDSFNKSFSGFYRRMMEYLVLNSDIINHFAINEKTTELFTALLQDISKVGIPFEVENKLKICECREKLPFVKRVLRKLKKLMHRARGRDAEEKKS